MQEKQKLTTDRSFPMYVLLDIITMHIYQAFMLSKMSKEINIVAQDGKKTVNYMYLYLCLIGAGLLFGLGFWVKSMVLYKIASSIIYILTIILLIWLFRFSDRIGKELKRREVAYEFGAKSFVYLFVLPMILGPILGFVLVFLLKSTIIASIILVPVVLFSYVYFYKLIEAVNRLNKAYNETI